MVSRKFVFLLFVGLVASFFWNSNFSNPLKSTFRSYKDSHKHSALTLRVLDPETGELITDARVQLLFQPEVQVIEDSQSHGVFYLSRKAGWDKQSLVHVNLVAAASNRNPRVTTLAVGLDCEESHQEEVVEVLYLEKRTEDKSAPQTLEAVKEKLSKKGGAAMLVDALERNSIDTGLARLLTDAKMSDRIENVLILFRQDPERVIARTPQKANMAWPGFGSLPLNGFRELKGMPAAVVSASAKEILLYSNLASVYFMAKID